MRITDFKSIETKLIERDQPKTIAVVNATDATTRGALAKALASGVAQVVFVGAREQVEADERLMPHAEKISIIDTDDADDAAAKAVALVRQGKADVLMKGMLNTDNLLRAILNNDTGILPKGNVLTHLTVVQASAYPKLLIATDVAVIPYPTDAQREAELRYALDFARKLGISRPRVALIHCTEKVDERHFPFTVHYKALIAEAAVGKYGECIVDGPLDVKTACSKAALEKKGLTSAVDGEADILIFPDIEAGNTFYKTLSLFTDARMAGMLSGCTAPVVLPSRGDNVESKYTSLLIAMFNA